MLQKLLAVCPILFASSLNALPFGGEVVRGQATLFLSANALQINANGKAILHWEQFNIAPSETIHFFQSQGNQAILNRVTSGPASEILGLLQANCPIYLINPKGVYIGNSACIETAGFLASTADLSNEVFWHGEELLFQDLADGSIVNLGKICAREGDVFLIARKIENQGGIEAPNGMAILSTREVMLSPNSKQCVFIRCETVFKEGGIQNSGSIQASAVELHTCSPYEKAIRHTGTIEAFASVEQNGRIYLQAEQGETVVDGSLLAKSGEIRVLGQSVSLESEAQIDASGGLGGKVLIGGDFQGSNPSVQNAQTATVADGAKISADGWAGDAGKIVVWASEQTECRGTISVQSFGGRGDGGFVEISGKKTLMTTSVPDLRSKSGKAGTLLLDPGTLAISAGSASGPNIYGSTYINATLALGNLTLDTSAGGSSQTLTIESGVAEANAITWKSANTLTLRAGQGVTIQSGAEIIAAGAGNLTIHGQDSLRNATYQGISIDSATLAVADGNLELVGFGGDTGVGNDGIAISGNSTISAGSGSLTLQGNGGNSSNGITKTGGAIATSGGGPLNMTGIAGSGGAGVGISLAGGTVSTTNSGSISLIGQGAGTAAGSNGVDIATDVVVEGTGTLTINGRASALAGNSNGICVTGGIVSTASGLMALTAQGGGAGNGNNGLFYTGGSITTGNGGIAINAIGSTGAGTANSGIHFGPVSISATGRGNIEIISAIGSTNAASSGGVGLQGNTCGSITTNTGSISINAVGSSASIKEGNIGVYFAGIASAGVIQSGSNLNMTAIGSAGAGSGSGNRGLQMDVASDDGRASITAAGALMITAIGAANGSAGSSGNIGLLLGAQSQIKTTGPNTLTITATGDQYGASSGATGLAYRSADTAISAIGTGSIVLNLIGAQSSTAGGHVGLSGDARASIATNSGSLTINAMGGSASTKGGNIGVNLIGVAPAGSILSGSSLTITATGSGGVESGSENIGLQCEGKSLISSLGALTITAAGSPLSAVGSNNIGIKMAGGAVQSIFGSITLNGSSGGQGTGNQGVLLASTSSITTENGNISVTGTGGGLFGSENHGILLSSADASIASTNGTISLIGNGGFASHGLHLEGGTISTSGAGNIIGYGTGAYGVYLAGTGSLIQTADGSIALTGNGAGSGDNADGIGIFAFAKVASTGTGRINLNGAASLTGGDSSRGIVVNGAGSTVSSHSGMITINGAGGGSGVNSSGLEVSCGGAISSTTGLITGVCIGGAGKSGCAGISVAGAGSLITAKTGSGIDLTGRGGGRETSNQGISLAAGGKITTTDRAPIILTGTGSPSGAAFNEGIFLTGAATVVSTDSGAIRMTGFAGGGSSDGIAVDSHAAILSSKEGAIALNSPGNAIAIQNGGCIKTEGKEGFGINDIVIASNGLSVLGGSAGGALVSTVNGNVSVNSTGPVNVLGGAETNSFGQITVGNRANTVDIRMAGLNLAAGSGVGSFAEISTLGGLLSIDGPGAISLAGGSNTNTQAQIITKTNSVSGDAIRIGQIAMPESIALQGGSGGTLARAVIATEAGGDIVCSAKGNYTITGGTSESDSRAGFYTGLATGAGNISLSGVAYALTGGATGGGYNSAEILTPVAGGDIRLTYANSPSSLQGSGAATSNARIITLGKGSITINGEGNFSALGGEGENASADVNAQGSLTMNIGPGDYVCTGGSGASSLARFTATGAVSVIGRNYTLTGGSNEIANASNALIESTGVNGSVWVLAKDAIVLNGGTAANQYSTIQTTANAGENPITVACGSLCLNGSTAPGAVEASAEIKTVFGDVAISVSGDISLLGGTAIATNALIGSTGHGAMTLSAANLSILGGVGKGTSGIVTEGGDIAITCSQNVLCSAPNPDALAAIQTFGSDFTLSAGDTVDLSGSTILSTPAPTGNLLLMAGKTISIGTSSQVVVNGTVDSSLTLVHNADFGEFILDTGGVVSAGVGTPVKIYTSRRSQNTIQDAINGTPFVPGPLGINTTTEQWGLEYPADVYGGDAFTIYYREPKSINNLNPTGYDQIAENLVQLDIHLPILNPILNKIPGHYHFQFCNKVDTLSCDPTFSPYGSFIFEDDVYWIEADF